MASKIFLISILLVLSFILTGCTDIKDSQVLNTAKDMTSDVKDILNDTAKDLIGELTDKLNDTATNPDAQPNENPAETIKIASWNIENFGKTKATDPERMQKIAAILKDYDIIAVQEISNVKEQSDPGCPRNKDVCPGDANCGLIRNALETYLNDAYNENYEFVFSPQIKDERYLYIYDPDSVEFINAALASDPLDSLPICDTSPQDTGRMVRQPFIATFRAGDFSFMLMTAHTSPSINEQELEGLSEIFEENNGQGYDNIIILGDLNADCSYLKERSTGLNSLIWMIDWDEDTTVSNTDCAYDRFLWTYGTQDYFSSYGIFKNITDDISDHYLVWSEFRTAKN